VLQLHQSTVGIETIETYWYIAMLPATHTHQKSRRLKLKSRPRKANV